MDRQYGNVHYRSFPIEDVQQGFVGLELYRVCQDQKDRVARIVFWDATGQFSIETCGTDIPLEILESLIVEVKESVKTS